jgi:hypothetical protein
MPTDEQLPTKEELDRILSEPDETFRAFTPDEVPIAKRLLPMIARKAAVEAETKKAKELDMVVSKLKVDNEAMIRAELEKIRSANKPLDPAELEKLISQEYLTIPVRFQTGKTMREFTLVELPQEAETKFVRTLQKSLVPHLKRLNSVEWTTNGSVAEKIQQLIETMPELLEIAAELSLTCLDPFGDEGLDVAWIKRYLSTTRIVAVIRGQIAVNRYRDFFSLVSQAFPT